jgi:tRNA modification GTPase
MVFKASHRLSHILYESLYEKCLLDLGNAMQKKNTDLTQTASAQTVFQQDAIAAVATAAGEAALSIIRLSGDGVFGIADKIFRKSGDVKFSFAAAPSHTAHYGFIVDKNGETLDEVMAILYKSPRTFTMEDCVEFNCHGGIIVTQTVLESILDAGCRLAEAGEFTRRAFLNGRIDLVQAEAIGEMIHAKTEAAYRAALSELKGDLSKRLTQLREDLLNACSMLELELDFGEEDVQFQSRDELISKTAALKAELESLAATFKHGKLIREGVATAIAGKPNAGKSTLLNALLGKERAIVSDIAGTTRDYIEEQFSIDGILFRLIDTAGLRLTDNLIESEGIKRSREKISEADLILYLYDASAPLSVDEQAEIDVIRKQNSGAAFLLVGNKTDRLPTPAASGETAIMISALQRDGVEALKRTMRARAVGSEKLTAGSVMLTNLRHYEAVRNALESLTMAEDAIQAALSTELISADLRAALNFIGEITGKVSTDDILNNIFQKFCIGK